MSCLRGVCAVILAGGLGTRLRPVVADRPKVLAEVCGRPFVTYLLDRLTGAGIGRIVICTGYMGEQVKAALGDRYGAARLAYSQEERSMGTAGAVRLALPLLDEDRILIMNGDSYCEVDLDAFLTQHREWKAEATLLLTQVSDTRRYGRVMLDDSGRVIRFEEKAQTAGLGWISAGVYLVERPLVEGIPDTGTVSLERDVFPACIGKGLYGYCADGRFVDIGIPDGYLGADQFILARADA